MAGEMQRARLIPTTGIGNDKEAEQRATSALLAVMTIVRDFSVTVLCPYGASRAAKASVEAFTEVEIVLPTGQKVRPDGLLRVSYGSGTWSALVEVKTGDATLEADQLNNYLVAAKEIGADVVVSISNELGVAGAHPTKGLKVRSNSKITVEHLSWSELLAHAVQCKVHAGVDDPEQAWILSELIRYLEHPASGAVAMSDMGPNWVEVRDGAKLSTLRKSSSEVQAVVAKWDELVRYLAIRLRSETGADVSQVLPKDQRDATARVAHLAAEISDDGCLSGRLRIPNSVGDVTVDADLRARQVVASVDVQAPSDKRARGSVSWLIRQITSTAKPGLMIEAYPLRARAPMAATLGEAAEDPLALVTEGQDINRFTLSYRSEMGQSRKTGGRNPGFIDTVIDTVDSLYAEVVQNITPWAPPAPQVKRIQRDDTETQPKRSQAANDGTTFGRRADDVDAPASSSDPTEVESAGAGRSVPAGPATEPAQPFGMGAADHSAPATPPG